MIRLMLFTINHRFLPLKSRRNTSIYGAEKLQNFSISKHGRHSLSCTCDKYTTPHGRETKLYFYGIKFQNIFLRVLIAKEIIWGFVEKINMPTAMSGISSAFAVNRGSLWLPVQHLCTRCHIHNDVKCQRWTYRVFHNVLRDYKHL
jgi:hypothetical protein